MTNQHMHIHEHVQSHNITVDQRTSVHPVPRKKNTIHNTQIYRHASVDCALQCTDVQHTQVTCRNVPCNAPMCNTHRSRVAMCPTMHRCATHTGHVTQIAALNVSSVLRCTEVDSCLHWTAHCCGRLAVSISLFRARSCHLAVKPFGAGIIFFNFSTPCI